ncbi:hypothetical protein [Cellulomonas sp. P22]|uniref:hypothetical protein n=1 Tax=Cellulomonas sp. P22 TaxID=3373189 RepID=UPI0037BFA793
MTPAAAGKRPRRGMAILCALASWIIAAVLAVIASLSGSQFAAGPAPDPSGSVVFWALAGVFVALPVAALPSLGFTVRRGAAWAAASLIVVAVTLVGVFVLNTP